MLHILLCSYFLVKDYVDRILQPVFTALSVFPTITQQTVEIFADHIIVIIAIITTRPKLAYGRQGLDLIVGPGYSFVVFSTNKTMETNHNP